MDIITLKNTIHEYTYNVKMKKQIISYNELWGLEKISKGN